MTTVDKCPTDGAETSVLADSRALEEMDPLDRMLPAFVRHTPVGPGPEPEGARLVWRLRAWEMHCLTEREGAAIWHWLYANDLGKQREVLYGHDISVWRHASGRREIGCMREEQRRGRKQPWVAVPTLVPLTKRPPTIRHRYFLHFDKFQRELSSGHQGRTPQYGRTPCCPACTRAAGMPAEGTFVPWPCPPLTRWMPRWLRERWEEEIERRVRENEEMSKRWRR